jgi:Domain of Unknown Function (DUF748)
MQPSAASIVIRDKLRRKRRRRWFIATGVVVGLLLFGFLGLPPIIRTQAVKHLSAALNRDVSIEKIRLNPLVLSVTIEGLDIKDRDGGPFTRWERLYVNFDSFSVFTGEWHFQEITLDGFSQRVAIAKDGAFNFADLIPPPAKAPAATSKTAKPPRPLRVTNLAVNSASLSFADASRNQPFATVVGPLSFKLKEFHTGGDPKAPYEFTAITESGETFAWKGTLSVNPPRSAGEFTLGKIALKKYAPYYADFMNADLLDGLLDVSATYAIDLAEATRELKLSNAAIKLTRLQVASRGTAVPLVDLPSFSIDGLNADGIKQSATIRRIALDGGRLTVVREKDGSINLLNLLAAKTAPAAPATPTVTLTSPSAPAAPAPLPDVQLTEFALSGLAIDFEDRTTPTPAKNGIGRLDINAQNISLAQASAPVLLKIALEGANGGTVAIDGSAVREPLAADLAVKVAAFPLAGVTPYIEPLVNLRISSGAVSVDGKARLAGTVASFTGDVVVDKFATVDGVKAEEFAGFRQFAFRGIDALSEPLTARITEISLTEPTARVVVNADQTTNLATVLRTPAAAPEPAPGTVPAVVLPPASGAPAKPAAPAPVWSLGKFTLVNGSVTFVDRSIKPAARIALDQFSGTVTGLSSADMQRADVDIRGKLNGSGTIAFTGKLDAKAATLAPGALTEIVVDVKNVDLSPISPYVGTYAGYELARSGLTVDVKASLGQRKINSENVITLNQFTLGAPTNSPQATKLPVRLGVALLRDMDGNIVLPVPVKGDLDDPKFKIGRVVLNVIVNVLVKAATSPFSLIGAAFGGGGDELAYQDFAPGAQAPLETELSKLDTLRKALKGRPALNLDITGSYDPAADLDAVRGQILNKQVRFRRWEELRKENPNTPPASEVTVTPEDELRIMGMFMAERYPAGVPAPAVDGTLPPPAPLYTPVPPPASKPKTGASLNKTSNVFAGRPAPPAAPKTEPVKPVVLLPVAESGTAIPADGQPALTLADARRALAAGIPVPTEELLKLADERAQQVRAGLLASGEIDAGRLLIAPPAPEGKGARVFLQLR